MVDVITERVEVSGRTRVKVTVRDGDKVLDAEMVDPFNVAQRRKTAERLAKKSRYSDSELAELRDQIELLVLQKANEPREKDAPALPEQVVDGDNVWMVRPELIVVPGVVGVSVPETVIKGQELIGRWRMYLAWADGKRETRELSSRIESPSCPMADTLWVQPIPPDPAAGSVANWSGQSRSRWLEGAGGEVTVSDVFDRLVAALGEYIDVGTAGDAPAEATPPKLAVLALWTMLTYVYPAWDAVPYLYVGGPAASGKTRVFEILSRVCFGAMVSSNLSAAALFRTLHDRGGTLLLDEAERLNEGAPEVAELRSILLAGYKRGGKATRLESVGDGYRMTEFQVFGAKAIACINGVTGALATRCIPFQMLRSDKNAPQGKRRVGQNPALWQSLRDDLYLLLMGPLGQAAPLLAEMDDVCPLSGRAHELWQPLLAIATMVDPEEKRGLVKSLVAHAQSIVEGASEDQFDSTDLIVLQVLTRRRLKGEEPTPAKLLEWVKQENPVMFQKWAPRKLADCLRTYGITTRRSNGKRLYSPPMEYLKKLEQNYSLDLNTEGISNMVEVRLY